MRSTTFERTATFALSALLACAAPDALRAQTSDAAVAAFYKDKTISVVIGYPSAGTNDQYARAVAQHIGKHVPGSPVVVPRNMPGGGSLVAANHIFNIAPKDGTTLGLIVPTAALEERLGSKNVRYKAAEFNWIGRLAPTPNVTFVKSSSPVKTIQDALKQEATLGSTGKSSTATIYPALLNMIIGTKFKLVMGYKGSAEAMLAMDRGEVEGHSTTWDGVKSRAAQHLKDNTITILVQHGLTRHPELPSVPASVELARSPAEAEALRLFANASDIGRFILATPDTPADRITALRRAFDAMVKDKDFIAELQQQKLELGPLTGEELQKIVAEVSKVSETTVARVKALYEAN